MSPTLFSIYVAGLEEELRKGQVGGGGIVVGERKVWSLTYADDIVLMTDREEELKEMLKRFEKFLKETELELNTKKAKSVVFEKKKEQEETKKMEMGRARIRRSGRDKIPRVHTTEKRQ